MINTRNTEMVARIPKITQKIRMLLQWRGIQTMIMIIIHAESDEDRRSKNIHVSTYQQSRKIRIMNDAKWRNTLCIDNICR